MHDSSPLNSFPKYITVERKKKSLTSNWRHTGMKWTILCRSDFGSVGCSWFPANFLVELLKKLHEHANFTRWANANQNHTSSQIKANNRCFFSFCIETKWFFCACRNWKIIMGNPPTNVPMKTEEKNNIGSNNKNYYTREQKLEKRRRLTVGLTTERNCWHVLVTLLMNAAKHGESMWMRLCACACLSDVKLWQVAAAWRPCWVF